MAMKLVREVLLVLLSLHLWQVFQKSIRLHRIMSARNASTVNLLQMAALVLDSTCQQRSARNAEQK